MEAFFVLLRLLTVIYGADFTCSPVNTGQVCTGGGLRIDYSGKAVVIGGLPGAAGDIRLDYSRGAWVVKDGKWSVKNDKTGRANTVKSVNLKNRAVRLSSGLCRLNAGGGSCHPLVLVKKSEPTVDAPPPTAEKPDMTKLSK